MRKVGLTVSWKFIKILPDQQFILLVKYLDYSQTQFTDFMYINLATLGKGAILLEVISTPGMYVKQSDGLNNTKKNTHFKKYVSILAIPRWTVGLCKTRRRLGKYQSRRHWSGYREHLGFSDFT